MPGATNRGKKIFLELALANDETNLAGSGFAAALCTADTSPTPKINLFSELTEVSDGNGYTSGGVNIDRNTTDWDTFTEDDTNDLAKALVKDISWTASGGQIVGIRYVVLTDRHATVSSRQVLDYWDIGGSQDINDGETLTFEDLTLRAREG